MSVLLPLEISVLAIHAVVMGWELAGHKRRKEARRRDDARRQEIERKLRQLARACPECVLSCSRDDSMARLADWGEAADVPTASGIVAA